MFGFDDAALATAAVGGLGFIGQQLTNSAQSDAADKQMEFQQNNSNTAYQRQVADLQAAGLNPMLAYIKGGGASTPPGAMATYTSPVTGAVQAATSAQVPSQIRKTGAETSATEAHTNLTNKEIQVRDETIGKIKAESSKIAHELNKIDEESKNLTAERERINTDIARIQATVTNLGASTVLMVQQGVSEQKRKDLLEATAIKAATEGLITQAEYEAMRKTNFLGVLAREVKVFSDIGSDWVGNFLPNIFKAREGAANREAQERLKRSTERGTSYDAEGNVTGSYKRSRE